MVEDYNSARRLQITHGKIEASWASSDAIDLRVHGSGCVRVSQYSGGINNVASISAANTTIHSQAIVFSNLPTSDPGVVGQLWRDGAVLKVSV